MAGNGAGKQVLAYLLASASSLTPISWPIQTIDCGPRLSARLLASQLIRPLLSISHLALTSTSPPSDLSDMEVMNVRSVR